MSILASIRRIFKSKSAATDGVFDNEIVHTEGSAGDRSAEKAARRAKREAKAARKAQARAAFKATAKLKAAEERSGMSQEELPASIPTPSQRSASADLRPMVGRQKADEPYRSPLVEMRVGSSLEVRPFPCRYCHKELFNAKGFDWGERVRCPFCMQLNQIPKAFTSEEMRFIQQLNEIADAASGHAPSHLDSYEKRLAAASEIGEQLNRIGGKELMIRILDFGVGPRAGKRTIEGYWDGIGGWMG